MIRLGLDLGTKTIVLARRNDDGKLIFKHEVNGFYEFKKPDQFTRNLLLDQKIPFVERSGKIYALGSKAEKLAYAFNDLLRRPMAGGTVSDDEEAISIMASIVQAIIGKLDDDAILYYCIPADALNKSTNVKFHDKVARLIIESYKRTKAKLRAFSVNEARAIGIGSGHETVISISFGAGMVNVCYTMWKMPIFQFSLVDAGDWIDEQCAMRFGYDPDHPKKKATENPTSICRRKEKIDLSVPVSEITDLADKTISLHYQILIENVVEGIIEGFVDNKDSSNFDGPIPIVIAGGTASPNGFAEYFETILRSKECPFVISDITVVDKPLFAVSAGCLNAAQQHGDG